MNIPDSFLEGEIRDSFLCREYDEESLGSTDRSVE